MSNTKHPTKYIVAGNWNEFINYTKKEFDFLNRCYDELKVRCKHPFVRVTDRGDTGNYDPSQNRYWTEHYCPDCDKRWTIEKT
jgi:hypothetical protein